MDKQIWYRCIPKVDVLLEKKEIQILIEQYGRTVVLEAIRVKTEELREFIGNVVMEEASEVEGIVDGLEVAIEEYVKTLHKPKMRRVINGTGTILHTNLGRAVISETHMEQVARIATGYSNLEYNLEAGKRGERYAHFEALLCKVTGAEAAMAVNNNAAAVMLILNALGKGKEIVVSRGELVEIGGKFRIPDVMDISGAKLVEIGTTNKTHFSDYEDAITENTAALLKVHTSNYRIVGFTESVGMDELIPLGHAQGIPVIEDLGSGVLIDISKYGFTYEPRVQDAIAKGVDVVCFSGDKLLGGPQAGIIVGKKKYIDQMKKSQLTRALRIDKFTAAALEVVLQSYLSEEKAVADIPVLHMMTKSEAVVRKDAESLMRELTNQLDQATQGRTCLKVEPCESQIGGGSLPMERISSYAVTIKSEKMSTATLEKALRELEVPIIARVENDKILLDVRTIAENEVEMIARELARLL